MNLLAFMTDAFGGRGGIAKFNRDLLEAACSHPACERVVALPCHVTDPIESLPSNLIFDTVAARGKQWFMRQALHVVARTSYDGVICGHLHLMPLACLAAKRRRVPLLLIVHGIEAWHPPRRRVLRMLVRHADRIISVSEYTRRRFLSWSRVDPDKTAVEPNCIDLERFRSGAKSQALLERYGLLGRTVMLTVGRLAATERYKGIDELLEALPRLAEHLPAISYLIVGDGDDRPRLEDKAQRLGVRNRVVFAGYVNESEKADHYRLADVFAMPGRGEGFGIVYLEAMACGVPVVASSADASREAVRDGSLGIVVDPGDSNQLVGAILKALQTRTREVPRELDQFSKTRFLVRWRSVFESTFVPALTIGRDAYSSPLSELSNVD